MIERRNIAVCIVPVSYTHLDVYKRQSRRCRPKPCPRQYPPWIKAACKIFLIKFHLMRLFFVFFVSVNEKDKICMAKKKQSVPEYGTVTRKGTLYYLSLIHIFKWNCRRNISGK